MVYTVSTKNYLGNKTTIVVRDNEGYEIPVLNVMPSETDFPGDIQALAANIVSLLNGNEPLHRIGVGDNRVFWQSHPYGMELRLQRNEKGDRT